MTTFIEDFIFVMNLLFLGLSAGSIMVILLAILLLFGSKEIPQMARALGRTIREVKNATTDIQDEVMKGAGNSEVIKDIKRIKDDFNITKNL
jgi:sec-independent protein translocase protein TatA